MGKTRRTADLVSDDNIFVDIANDRVGIGSTIPSSTLNVVGIVSATSFVGDGANISNVPYTSLTGVTTNIVADTTPQLGGDLDLNSQNITGTGNANITGVVTATSFKGDGSGLTKVFSAVNFILS